MGETCQQLIQLWPQNKTLLQLALHSHFALFGRLFFVVGSILPSSSSRSGTSCCEGVGTFFSMSMRVTFQTFGPMIGAKTKQTSHQVASPLNSCLMICSPVKPFKASRRTLPLANMSRWIYTMVDGVFGSMCTSITCDASLALPAPFSNNMALSK